MEDAPSPPGSDGLTTHGDSKPRSRIGTTVRVFGALAALYLAIPLAALPAAFVGLVAQKIPETFRPQWGSTLPSPLAELVAVLIGIPLLSLVRFPLKAPHLSRGSRALLVSLVCVVAVSAGGGFFAGIRTDVIPPEGLAARELLEGTSLRGYRFVDEGNEGNANISPYREFVGENRELEASDITGLPPDFEQDPEMANRIIWLYSEAVAAWSGPHPWNTIDQCWITAEVLEPYPDDPPNRDRATIHAFCDPR